MLSHKEDVINAVKVVSEDMPLKFKETLLENFQVEGVAPMTRDQVSGIVAQHCGRLGAQIEVLRGEIRGAPFGNNNQIVNNPEMINGGVPPSEFRTFLWGGRIHMVPEEFELASCSVYTIWSLWFRGNPASGIQPYKRLQAFDLKRNVDKVNLTRIRKVISALEQIIYEPEHGILAVDRAIASLSPAEDNDVFNRSFVILCKSLYDVEDEDALKRLRIADKNYNTIYEHLRKQ